MRVLIAAVCLSAMLAACGDGPSTSDPGTTPNDGVTQPAPEGAPQAVPGQADMPPAAAPTPGEQGGASGWREVVTAADAGNLGRLDQAWRLARAEAEDKGFAKEVEALGPLVDPNAGLERRLQPSPGTYRCRTIKLGTKAETGLAYVAYPFFRCSVELTPGGDLILAKTTGSQRTRGLLYPDTDARLVFVGAQAWGMDETSFPAYGEQPVRDQVGVFERIGPERWRMVVPWPRVESKLEILEVVR